MGLLSTIKSFLGLNKKQEDLKEINVQTFVETFKSAPVITPDPVVLDTESVKETLEVKTETPKKEKKVVVKKEQNVEATKTKPEVKKPIAEKQKAKKQSEK